MFHLLMSKREGGRHARSPMLRVAVSGDRDVQINQVNEVSPVNRVTQITQIIQIIGIIQIVITRHDMTHKTAAPIYAQGARL
jgi:hypothetical protein